MRARNYIEQYQLGRGPTIHDSVEDERGEYEFRYGQSRINIILRRSVASESAIECVCAQMSIESIRNCVAPHLAARWCLYKKPMN